MAETKTSKQRAPRRSWPLAEKRRIVELTQRSGVSIVAIAREHGVPANSVYSWTALHRAGKLTAKTKLAACVAGSAESTSFLPVRVVPKVRSAKPAVCNNGAASNRNVIQLLFASGTKLHIESDALNAALVCAIVAELQR